MARHIDADKLCRGLRDMASVQYPDRQNAILGVISTIENMPTADVVEVVRCKECSHRNPYCHKCLRDNLWHDDDDFCSYGEKRSDT